MGTAEQLHQAIADEPEEDTPRLAFADWLDEQGGEANSTRAEFIRLQVMLARLGAETGETRAARQRAADLLERYRSEWGFPTGHLRGQYIISRGFIEELRMGSDRPFEAPAPVAETLALLPLHPVTRLRISAVSREGMGVFEVFELLDMPAFRKVRHLEVTSETWTDEALGRLLQLDEFPLLDSFAVTSTGITPTGVAGIADCPQLTDLRTLRISFAGAFWLNPGQHVYRGVRDEGAVRIASSPVLANLRNLSLRQSAIGSVGAVALAESPMLNNLERLTLTENPDIDQHGRDALVRRYGDRVFLSPSE